MALAMASGRAGFVVLEGPRFAINWGDIDLRGLSEQAIINKIVAKIAWFLPDVLILEDAKAKGCRKGDTSRKLIKHIEKQAELRAIDVRFIARLAVRRFFGPQGETNKDKIARLVARQLPELERELPKTRKSWDPEQYRMALFEAASYALTYFKTHEL